MHISSLGALVSGALAALRPSSKDFTCRMWDKSVGGICPLITDTRPYILAEIHEKLGSDLGFTLEDMPNIHRSFVDLEYGTVYISYDSIGTPYPNLFHIEGGERRIWAMKAPNPWPAIMRRFAEDTRKWSATTDLVFVPPPMTKDLIVRPVPGELIVWVPPNTCAPGERPRRKSPPSLEVEDGSVLANFIHTVLDGTRQHTNFVSRRTVIGLYALVSYLAIATLLGLEPLGNAWRGSTLGHIVGHLGVSAVLGSVGFTLYGSTLLGTALNGLPTDAEVQQAADDDMDRLERRRDAARRDNALMASPRPIIAYDLANYKPLPHFDHRPLLIVFRNGPIPTPLAIVHPPMRPRTWSSMTVMEARAAPSNGPMKMSSEYEDETFCKNTLLGSKALLRRQAPGVKLFGLWKSAVRRHEKLRALRDEMGEDVALRHAQEGREILRQNLRTMIMMGIREQLSVQDDD
ncbi:hypothetical protein DAEQUDRAFT_739931 [Daedalea quercina L-15889]|uniref:Uncharacterized protein n=1 Tax=Daedalea quercina L-15889 TaxID=1314783 RepID=A0A165N696_9APHY|nr:hypothetical protein DAEQUDRAFT_739931 [Daedalea quercina L-15889]